MRKFERLNSEQEVLNHLEDLVSQGVNEHDIKVVSKYRVEEISARFPDVDFKDSEGGIMDKIAALFSEEDPEDKMLNNMALSNEEKEECRQAIDQGQFLVFNAHNDFDGALEGDRFDMSKDGGQDGLNNTQKTEATMAGAQFGAHDAGRETGFNENRGIEDEVREDVVNNNEPDNESLDPMGPEKNSAPRENAFNDNESHDGVNDEYLQERKDDEEFSTERENEGMDTDNERNKNYAFGKDNPYDQTSELDQDKSDDDMNNNLDSFRNETNVYKSAGESNMNTFNNNNDMNNNLNNNDEINNKGIMSESERREANNERTKERDAENKAVAGDSMNSMDEQNNVAIDGVNRRSENGGSEKYNAAIDGVERRTVNADRVGGDDDRRGEDYDPLLDDNHAADETRSEDNVPNRDERVEELSREPYDDDEERLRNEQDVDREVRRTEDIDYDDDAEREKRSSDLRDSLRADDAREDAFDHDKGRF